MFALLASLSLYGRYKQDREGFIEAYVRFLATGNAASPAEQLGALGMDITRADCWDAGFAEIERLIGLAEEA